MNQRSIDRRCERHMHQVGGKRVRCRRRLSEHVGAELRCPASTLPGQTYRVYGRGKNAARTASNSFSAGTIDFLAEVTRGLLQGKDLRLLARMHPAELGELARKASVMRATVERNKSAAGSAAAECVGGVDEAPGRGQLNGGAAE